MDMIPSGFCRFTVSLDEDADLSALDMSDRVDAARLHGCVAFRAIQIINRW